MRCSLIFLLAFTCCAVMGCSGNRMDVAVTPAAPPTAKAMLEEVAATGELGSGALAIAESLESLKATEPAKAEMLLRELELLARATNPQYVSAKAKELASKL